MIKRISSIIIFIFMLNLVSTAYAKEIKVVISVDKTVVEAGSHFRMTIGVQGAFDTEVPQITPPENFILMYGPSVSTQTSIVNNVVAIFRGFTYSFSPTETGIFELGPATLEYKGKVYTSNSVKIEVVKRTPFEGDVDPDKERSKRIDINKRIFVELETDKKEAYIYEQIVESFKLFFQKGLPIDDLDYVAASTKSFLAEKLGEERRYEEVRDGILYNVIELRTALFPLVSGNIEIPPAKFNCNIIIRQQGYRNSIFDEFSGRGGQKYPVERSTDSAKLKIKPLPESDKPDNFAGTVGRFTMDVLAKPTEVKVGDPITLSINIRGKGNIQTIGEPVLAPGDEKDFKIYPAETDTTITDRGDGIRGEKLFSKVVEPQHENIDMIPAISFSYFDPELEKYMTITHNPIPIVVEHSEVEIPIRFSLEDAEKVKGQVKILTKDILPIMSDLYSFKNQGFAIYNRPSFLAFIFLTPILVVIACVYVQRHRELLQTDVGYARKRRALSRAKKQLSNARRLVQLDNPSEFYSTLAKTVMEHIADKLNLAPASITSDNISGILENRGVSHDVIKELKECLESCDYGRFSASQHSKDQMVRTLDTAEEFIMHLEKQL
ncbi:MAG: BatD family protein [Candidatus Scalindua sp.]|nr:BatD family protein [Candidatus Scalindua sp.]